MRTKKRLPFNTERRPKLPNQILKTLNFPLYIGNIRIVDSDLKYQEKMPEIDEPMTVTLGDLNININRATSIRDSLRIRKNMKMRKRLQPQQPIHIFLKNLDPRTILIFADNTDGIDRE